MEPIQLQDLVPEGATFYLKQTDRTYRLKPITLADEIWMHQTFGQELEEIFTQRRIKDICRIAFHVMEEEDKVEFAAVQVKIMNDEGEYIEKRIGGAELLFLKISGYPEKIQIIEALLKTIGAGRPLIDKLEKKTSLAVNPPGGSKSSISSPQSTAGLPSTSSVEAPVKSDLESKPLRSEKSPKLSSKRNSTIRNSGARP